MDGAIAPTIARLSQRHVGESVYGGWLASCFCDQLISQTMRSEAQTRQQNGQRL